jgi:hypothetical protein
MAKVIAIRRPKAGGLPGANSAPPSNPVADAKRTGPSANKRKPSLLPFLPQIKIGDHFKVLVASTPSPEAKEQEETVLHRVIDVSDSQFRITERALKKNRSFTITNGGDLLLRISLAAGSQREAAQLRVMPGVQLASGDSVGCVLGSNVVALRVQTHEAAYAMPSMINLLNTKSYTAPSFLGEWLARQTTARSKRELLARLKELQVPVLPSEVWKTVEEAKIQGETIYEMLSIDEDLLSEQRVFEAQSRTEFDEKLLLLKTEIYALEQATTVARDQAYQIRNLYPFPLAFPYRLLTGITEPHESLRERFRIGECLFALLAGIALALNRPAPQEVARLVKARGRFSMGDWRDLGRNAALTIKPTETGADLPDALHLLWSLGRRSSFVEYAEKLVKLRNDYFHMRNAARLTEGIREADNLLVACMGRLSFLIRFPLFLVREVRIDRSTRKAKHTIHSYVGDHPGHDVSILELENPLPEGLYVQTEQGPCDLYPFVSVRECPNCGVAETFFLDRVEGESRWLVKSFERGHEAPADDIAEGLSRWREAK